MTHLTNAAQELVVGATNVVVLRRLRDQLTLDFLDDATVTGELYTDAGVLVVAEFPMAFVAGYKASDGQYRATISEDTALTVGASYEARITAVAADGSTRIFHVDCLAVEG